MGFVFSAGYAIILSVTFFAGRRTHGAKGAAAAAAPVRYGQPRRGYGKGAWSGLRDHRILLCAVRLCPAVRDYLFLSHDSYEVGYRIAAEELGLTPCLHLGMRLGEGSGCPLLFRVLEGACGVMRGMATFDEASIEDSYLDEIRAMDAFTVEAT